MAVGIPVVGLVSLGNVPAGCTGGGPSFTNVRSSDPVTPGTAVCGELACKTVGSFAWGFIYVKPSPVVFSGQAAALDPEAAPCGGSGGRWSVTTFVWLSK